MPLAEEPLPERAAGLSHALPPLADLDWVLATRLPDVGGGVSLEVRHKCWGLKFIGNIVLERTTT